MPYKIFETKEFSRIFITLDNNEKLWITNQILKLKENITGKPLRFSWFREKKFLNKRLYFLINEKKQVIILVAFGDKKDQKEIRQMLRIKRH